MGNLRNLKRSVKAHALQVWRAKQTEKKLDEKQSQSKQDPIEIASGSGITSG